MADSRRTRFEAEALVYLDELFRVARRVMGDTAAAEDVVQEACLRAWQAFDRFEPGTNCRAWLYKILFRTIAARRREVLREMAMFDDQLLDAATPVGHRFGGAGTPPVGHRFSGTGTPVGHRFSGAVTPDAHQIQQAFAALPLAFATVIHLVDVEGLKYKEVAEALDVPVGTVMSRLHRGRRQLRLLLAPGPALLKGVKERS